MEVPASQTLVLFTMNLAGLLADWRIGGLAEAGLDSTRPTFPLIRLYGWKAMGTPVRSMSLML